MAKLIVVDKDDQVLGYEDWQKCHANKGLLHRAFSVFVFNDKGELLIQQRSKQKPLWPGFWANTCCSHPRKEEEVLEAAQRRLREELGFSCDLKILYKFHYQASYKNKGSENELCYVLVGKHNGQVKPNKDEVAGFKWVSMDWLEKEIKKNPNKYTPWFKKIIQDKRFNEKS